ncbi:WD40 repeat-like protein [Backusella circina FSU 941]|nr:WD40 repeat-like protein [Backusella circina FSU 941]
MEIRSKRTQPSSLESDVQNDGQFIFKQFKYYNDVPTTISHWQLRSLIASPKNNTIIHPIRDSIFSFNTKTEQDSKLISGLPFEPTAIDTNFGYLALAGRYGGALIKDLSGEWQKSFNTGSGMNNSIHLSQHGSNDIRLTVCNNDESVLVYDVPNMHNIVSLKMSSAANYASVSPDGRKMVCVDDSGESHLYSISSHRYEKIASYKVSRDPCASCAWNSSSDIFATTSQDGHITAWDIQNGKEPIFRVNSTEKRRSKKAARAIQFSKGPLDLLAYTEHVSIVNILDMRTFDKRQIVSLKPFGSGPHPHIAGLAFSPNNKSLYVGLENSIAELYVNTSERRRFSSYSHCL